MIMKKKSLKKHKKHQKILFIVTVGLMISTITAFSVFINLQSNIEKKKDDFKNFALMTHVSVISGDKDAILGGVLITSHVMEAIAIKSENTYIVPMGNDTFLLEKLDWVK